MRKIIFTLLAATMLTPIHAQADFARGADISWCTEMEADGKYFYNAAGEEKDIFVLMKELGMTAIRLRVWVNPSRFGYGAWNDSADVVNKAKRAHAQGLDLMIDFHYSDFFADPGTQNIPLDWQDYMMEQLQAAMAMHTRNILQALKDEGIEPKWVQVGNETNSGMLNPLGKIDWELSRPERFTSYVALSNAGYDAVKQVLPNTSVIIHLGGAENPQWFFPNFLAAGGKVDMIGVSHYPTADEWNSTANDATHSNINAAQWVAQAAQQFNLPVMICETGFDVNQPALADQVMQDLFAHMTAIPQCAGIFYWEPEVDGMWRPAYYANLGWGAYGLGAFTTNGKPTAALNAFAGKTQGLEETQINNKSQIKYNLLGQQVGDDYYSIVIQNGKKQIK